MSNSDTFSSQTGAYFTRLFCVCCGALLLSACEKPQATPQPPSPPPAAAEQGPHFSAANAYAHTAALCDLGPRPSGSPAYEEQVRYLEKHLTAAGWHVEHDRFTPLPDRAPMENLRAVFGEGAAAPRPILISCHIDTKQMPGFIGADDGASGAGVLLELARTLAQQPELAAQVELVFLDGEEAFAPRMSDTDGLYGSKYDVARRGGALPSYQINLDMVGGRDAVIAVPAADTSDTMLSLYAASVLAAGLSPERWTCTNRSYLDDHRPYLEAGVDSLNLIAAFSGSSWWHTRGDKLERLSPRTMGECGRLVMQLVQRLTQPPARR